MKKIDRETVQHILDTAEIVEVVSDYVNLKRRGTSYLGLCPFHNERTPSFSVSKAKNICKCFSCGKGGSPVNFIMEIEQVNYNEALRMLAKKYNIEIKEHELTDEERERESERASLMAINDFALNHFEHNLTNTPGGRNIALSYFTSRGLTEASIKRFHLGYALDQNDTLYQEAISKGYAEKYLLETGLCIRTDKGRIYDRFKGRVIFPVFSVSGKVVAFGGRTLVNNPAKYVNSPESAIYHKSSQLYGLYQAKPSIVKLNKCILVEGYMDVISMSQSGIENVVASSGTSLTEGQIRMIHRFTSNVTVIYDGDAAGIKASLRGIDMLLAEGLNIKVLLLPDGDDPDSFSRKHSSSELIDYINTHEVDFIQFKTDTLLQGVDHDPLSRAKAIADIVQSIAVIPDPVTRNVYITECSRRLSIDERIVRLEVKKKIGTLAEKAGEKRLREKAKASIDTIDRQQQPSTSEPPTQQQPDDTNTDITATLLNASQPADTTGFLRPFELEIMKYVIRYGMLDICDAINEQGDQEPIKVIDYINAELTADDLTLTSPDLEATLAEALSAANNWPADRNRFAQTAATKRADHIAQGEANIRSQATDLATIQRHEKIILEQADTIYNKTIADYAMTYIERSLSSSTNDNVRATTLDLAADKHQLSKVHTKYAHIETDDERLPDLVPRAIYAYKDAILECRLRTIRQELKNLAQNPTTDLSSIQALMESHQQIQQLRSEFAKYLGERIINPRK